MKASKKVQEPSQLSLGELIRNKRRDLGLNQAGVAALFQVNQSTVAKWERGDPVKIDRLAELADWLEIGFEEAFRASRVRPPRRDGLTGDVLQELTDRLAALEAAQGEMMEMLRASAPPKPAERGPRAPAKQRRGGQTAR